MAGSVFTIGHSNHPLDRFLELLRRHAIDVLVDVRSQPYSRYVPYFNTAPLRAAVEAAGLQYAYLGAELGGLPRNPAVREADGSVSYARLAATPAFAQALDRIERGIGRYRVALMCAEEDPSNCHRRRLITPALVARGIEVFHIRGDGRVAAEADLAASHASDASGSQPTLFHTHTVQPT